MSSDESLEILGTESLSLPHTDSHQTSRSSVIVCQLLAICRTESHTLSLSSSASLLSSPWLFSPASCSLSSPGARPHPVLGCALAPYSPESPTQRRWRNLSCARDLGCNLWPQSPAGRPPARDGLLQQRPQQGRRQQQAPQRRK